MSMKNHTNCPDQRYYASTYGRFNTPDRKKGNGANPGSLNKYAYVAGDPINKNDPKGLCAVMIAGSAQWGLVLTRRWTSEVTGLGADQAYPNQGQTLRQSVGSVAQQASNPNASTATALAAIQYALSSNSGLVDIIAYSAGAAAFTAAYGELSAAQQARIGLVAYISPGAATQLANVQGTTSVILGSGVQDNLATIGTEIPQGIPIYDTSCVHQNLGCFFGLGFSQLATIQSNGSCNSPQTFTRSQALAAQQAATAAQQQQTPSWLQSAGNYMAGLASAFQDWVDSIPIEEVDEEIYFEPYF